MSDAPLDPRSYRMEEPEEKNFTVFPKGTYPFNILSVGEMKESQNGNPYIPLELEFFDKHGNTTCVYENLTFTMKAKSRIDSFLKCICGRNFEIGRAVDWESDAFLAWVKKQTCEAKLGTEMKNGRNGNYEVNRVEAYIYDRSGSSSAPAPAPKPAPAPARPSVPDDEDNIPF